MYLAVDIGGTKTLVAAFSRRGRVVRRLKFRTAMVDQVFLRDLVEALGHFTKYRFEAVTVAIPGVVSDNYWVHFGKRDWDGIDIYGCIKNLFSCPIFFENDANLAAVYESSRLPGRTVFLTFSTGIGGGVAEHGNLVPSFKIFEPGQWEFLCDGRREQWQNLAASSALERALHIPIATDIRGGAALREVARRVALGLPRIVRECQPDRIILGGPLGKIFKLYVKFLPELRVKYRRPRRPNESVIYGCYIYGKRKVEQGRAR